MNLKSFDRIITLDEIVTIQKTLNYAENEIHHPGAARAENFDLLDLIEQARQVLTRTARQGWTK